MNKLKQFMYRFGGTICAIAAFMAVYTDGRCGWKIYQQRHQQICGSLLRDKETISIV